MERGSCHLAMRRQLGPVTRSAHVSKSYPTSVDVVAARELLVPLWRTECSIIG